MDNTTVIVGICNINDRQHLCGLWATIDQAKKELTGYNVYAVSLDDVHDAPDCFITAFDHAALSVWAASIRDFDSEADAEGHNFCGTDADGFTLYEFDIAALPGFTPFSES